MEPIFNEKVAEKWNLWVRKQCMRPTCGWKLVEKSNISAKKKKSGSMNVTSRNAILFPKKKKKQIQRI